MNKIVLIIIILFIGAGGYFLFRGGGDRASQESGTKTPSLGVPAPGHESVPEMIVSPDGTGEPTEEAQITEPSTPPVVPEKDEIKEFDMRAFQWDFDPPTLSVNKGDVVKLNITSIDVTHGFSLPAFNINERLEPGKTIVIEFTADKAGTFSFRCSVACGTGHGGMKGTLIVR